MRGTSRSLAVGLTLILILAIGLSAEAASKVRIATSTWVGYGPMWLAKALGYYEKEGLDVELTKIEDNPGRFAALASGNVDILGIGGGAAISFWKPELPVKVVMSPAGSYGGDGIVVAGEINKLEDLKGKRIGASMFSSMHIAFLELVKRKGMKPEDFRVVNMKASDMGAAFITGKLDAAITWEPWLTKAVQERPGAKILIDSSNPESPPLAGDALVVRADFVKNRPEDVEKVLRAIFKATEFSRKNPDQANPTMANLMGGWLKDPKVYGELAAKSVPRDLADNYYFFTTGLRSGNRVLPSIFDALGVYTRILLEQGELKEPPPLEQIIDSTFVKKIYKTGL
ncbi:MAG: hypothetical protein A3G35_10555 [candidate division NC10 bacterium RIFCSPLOWO2_12_FULL_66_18]|nr:MAG: hypothetical protein A3H39_00170 [candidate division NC10 bacterium RIFCSPLOWO2_02_FULL_66_22]OGC00371.1 MAG: hypothetical protein A3G35_10555 [candidate division NC10 bacterium RIFCSPLOWO2_12_FULL_66_18]